MNIGNWVIYDSGFKKEQGRIKSWNKQFIFVVYHCDNLWNKFRDYTGAATCPEDLTFLPQVFPQEDDKE